jgi:hypothetical protein
MKKPGAKTLIRIASVIGFLYAVGHSRGYPWTPGKGVAEGALIDGMKTLQFEAMGVSRTYWDFYLGFGISISVFLLAQALLLWQLSSLYEKNADKLRPLIWVIAGSYLLNAGLAWKFFFALPASFAAAIAILLVVASRSRK